MAKMHFKERILRTYSMDPEIPATQRFREAYLCNQAVGTKEENMTSDKKAVTCKNCIRAIKKVIEQDANLEE